MAFRKEQALLRPSDEAKIALYHQNAVMKYARSKPEAMRKLVEAKARTGMYGVPLFDPEAMRRRMSATLYSCAGEADTGVAGPTPKVVVFHFVGDMTTIRLIWRMRAKFVGHPRHQSLAITKTTKIGRNLK